MRLVEKGKNVVVNAAILVFDGVQIIDYTGPYEVFGQGHLRPFTVSETGKTITTSMGMSVNPAYSFETSPEPDVLLVPGGDVEATYDNPRVIEWIRAKTENAKYVMSVCNGAFILAKAGLLDGLGATTFYPLLDELETFAPKVRVVRDQRFVDNGKIITSAGLSSGIDAAIHLIGRIHGPGEAQRVALHLEYDWRPDSGFARGALAVGRLPPLREPPGSVIRVLSTQGDRDRWETRWALTTDLTASQVLANLNEQMTGQKGWSRAKDQVRASSTPAPPRTEGSAWIRTESSAATWRMDLAIESKKTAEGELVVAARIRPVTEARSSRK
jgi:putative intracellular protease/amidase